MTSKTEELYTRARNEILSIDRKLSELTKQRADLVEKKLQWQGAAEACLALGWETPSVPKEEPAFMKEGDE